MEEKIKEKLKSRRGEGYIDISIGIIAFVSFVVIAVNIFSLVTLRIELDEIAEDLISSATYYGSFGDEFRECGGYYYDNYYHYDIDYWADEYFNRALLRVQLGDRMWVKVSAVRYLRGLGSFRIPITLTVTKSGLSERYWK